MMDYLYKSYPQTLFINVGFSMGGNLTTLYMLRTPKEQRSRVIMAMSICQGYSATTSMPLYHHWSQGRRFYNQMIVENVKRILRRNYDKVVAPHVDSGIIDEEVGTPIPKKKELTRNYGIAHLLPRWMRTTIATWLATPAWTRSTSGAVVFPFWRNSTSL